MARRLALYSPVLVAVVAMLPRLLSAQFGLLDDGVTLRVTEALREHWPLIVDFTRETGRFFPAYFGFYTLVRGLAGDRAVGFFVANAVVLAAVTAMLIRLVRLRGGTPLQAWAAGMFFVLSSAAVECFYTLSKSEPPQLLWIMITLLLVHASSRSAGRLRPGLLLAAAAGTLLAAATTKETTLAMVPISAGWLLVGRLAGTTAAMGVRARCLAVSVVATVAFLGLRASQGAGWPVQGSYSRLYVLGWENVTSSLRDWAMLLVRDHPHLVVLAVAASALAALGVMPQRRLLLDCVIWMVGWIGVYLPWSWTYAYFMLAFTVGAAAFAGVVLGQIVQLSAGATRRWPRLIAGACLIAVAVLWPMALANTASHAATQLTVDAANDDLLRFAATLPRDASLLVDVPQPNEAVSQLGLHLGGWGRRPDIVVDHFPIGMRASSPTYVASPRMRNAIPRSVRLAFDEPGTTARAAALERTLGPDATLVHRIRRGAPRLFFNLHRPLCRLIGTDDCLLRGSFVDTRKLGYGWDVYRLNPS